MEPNQNQLPVANISGNETQDQLALIQRLVAEEVSKRGARAEPQLTQPQPVTITDPITGNELKFNTADEVRQAFSEVLGKFHLSQQQLATLAQQTQQQVQRPAEAKQDEFSPERFEELLKKDTLEGLRYGTSKALEGDLTAIRKEIAELKALKGEVAAFEFRGANPQIVPILSTPQGLQQFTQLMHATGRTEITRENLENTLALGVAQGLFPPAPSVLEKWRSQYDQIQQTRQGPVTPPFLGGGSGSGASQLPPAVYEQFDSLSLDQQEALLRKAGAFGSLQ